MATRASQHKIHYPAHLRLASCRLLVGEWWGGLSIARRASAVQSFFQCFDAVLLGRHDLRQLPNQTCGRSGHRLVSVWL